MTIWKVPYRVKWFTWNFIRNRCPYCKAKGTIQHAGNRWDSDAFSTYGVREFTCSECGVKFEQTGKTEAFR